MLGLTPPRHTPTLRIAVIDRVVFARLKSPLAEIETGILPNADLKRMAMGLSLYGTTLLRPRRPPVMRVVGSCGDVISTGAFSCDSVG